jgi:hypothetical protein
MVNGSDGSYFGYTYRWLDDGSDADLLTEAQTKTSTLDDGSPFKWDFPSRAQCMQCHTTPAGHVLGLRTHQLNGDYEYPTGTADNQLRTLNHLDLFTPSINEASLNSFARASDINDPHASVEEKVRSYLDSNCAQCHQPGGVYANFDARFTTPLASQGLVNGGLIRDYGIDGQGIIRPRLVEKSLLHTRLNTLGDDKMPPLAKNALDQEAVRVLGEWIHSLDPSAYPDNALPPEANYPPLARSDIAYISPTPLQSTISPLNNDEDSDGILDLTSLALLQTPAGTATISGPDFLYDPTNPPAGDSFTYRIADDQGLLSNEARITIELRAHHLNWLAQNFSAAELEDPQISGWTADPDGDGHENLQEYALATDPRSPSSLPAFTSTTETVGDQEYLTLTITKNLYADITYTIQATTDLDKWTTADVVTDTSTQQKARTPASDRTFLRLRVQLIE